MRDAGEAKSWLFTTLYREFLRGRRRADRVRPLEDLGPVEADPPAPEVDVVTGMDSALVVEALQEVDNVYRAPLSLFCIQDLSCKEIVQMLEALIGTVMSRLSRGTSQLREALARKNAGDRGKVVPFEAPSARESS